MNAPVRIPLSEEAGIGSSEVWVLVPGYHDYEVSSLGNLRRATKALTRAAGSILKTPARRINGYKAVGLRCDGRRRSVFVHRVVCEAFHGPQPTPEHQVAHFDGDKGNNKAENLRWATPLENAQDKARHGTIVAGDAHPARTGAQRLARGDEHWTRKVPARVLRGEQLKSSKLNSEDVANIKSEPHYYGIKVALAKKYGVSDALIGRIRRGLQWRHVDAS